MKYKYATKQNSLASLKTKAGKKHRVKKLLNSKNLIAGVITVVGSMLMAAQAEANHRVWDANGDSIWTTPDTNSFDTNVGGGSYDTGNDVNFAGQGQGIVSLRNDTAPGSITVSNGVYVISPEVFTATVNGPLNIPDNGTVVSNLVVTSLFGDIVISDLDVNLNISHNWDQDLDVFLTSPTGTVVELFTDVGGTGDNFTNTTLDDDAATAINAGVAPAVAPFTGSFQPEGTLADFNGQNLNNTASWQLSVTDDEAGIAGTLDSWSLIATSSGQISGAGSVTVNGTGDLTFTAANSYTGGTTVAGGFLRLNGQMGDNTTGTGDIAISGGTLLNLANEQIANGTDITITGGSYNLNGATESVNSLTNSGGTFVTGTGTLIGLGNTITWSGGTNTINNGGLVLDSQWDVSGGTNTVQGGAAGGVLQVQAGGTGLTFSGTGAPNITLNNSGAVAGSMLLQNTLTVANTITGTATISSAGAGANLGNINLDGGTRTFNVNADAANALATELSISAEIQNGGLTKTGAGTMQLTAANTYAGLTTVNNGILETTNAAGLGTAAAGTTVVSGASVHLNFGGNPAVAEQFNIAGAGDPGLSGALQSTGSKTLTAATLFVAGPSTIHSVSGTLTINSNITDGGGPAELTTFSVEAGSIIDVNGNIDGTTEGIRKIGLGTLDLTGSPNDYFGIAGPDTQIEEGVVIVDNDNNLGSGTGSGAAVGFTGVAGQAPTLRVAADIDFGAANRFFEVNGPLGQISVDNGFTATIDNSDLSFAAPTNILAQTGAGTLVIDATDAADDGVANDIGTTTTIAGTLDSTTAGGTLTVQGASPGPVNFATGCFGVAPAGTTNLVLNGLGNAVGGQAATANIILGDAANNLVFDNVNIQTQAGTNNTFAGVLTTTGNLLVTGPGVLNLTGTNNIAGNIHVVDNTLNVGNAGALGSSINSYDQQATVVWGAGTGHPTAGVLALSNNITLNERITLGGNARLDNLSGNNTITSEIRASRMDPAVNVAGPDDARIGATAGSLTLTGGITSGTSGTCLLNGQSVALNSLATDAGTLIINGQIQGGIVNLSIGNNALGTTVLNAANAYTGTTIINGGTVLVGNNTAFSGGAVTVNGASTIDTATAGTAVAIANNIAVNSTLSLGGVNNGGLALNGTITGAGGVTNTAGTNTLGGNNTYTGATTVTAGTLNINGASASNALNVNGGTLATNAGNLLSDGATLTVAAGAAANLGGSETILSLTTAGAVTVAGDLTTTGNSITVNNGGSLGVVNVNTTTVTTNGNGTLTASGNINAVNSITANGTSAISGVNINAATLTTTGTATVTATGDIAANTLTAGAGTTVTGVKITTANLTANGAVTASGDVTTVTLNGAATGVLTIGANTLTAQSGTFAGNVVGANGSLVKNGGGTLTLSGNNAGLTGLTTVNNGTLAASNLGSVTVAVNTGGTLNASGTFAATNINVANGGTLGMASTLAATATVNNSGTVNVTSGPNTIAALNFNAASGVVNVTGGNLTTGTLNGAAGTLNLAANSLNVTSGNFGGSIVGAGGTLTKQNAGVLTLSGNMAGFTGTTTVTGGVLALQSALGSTAVNVNATTTLTTSGNEQLANNATLTANGTVGLGGSETIATLNGGGTVNAGGNLTTTALNGSATVNMGTNTLSASNGTFGGTINGSGGLEKNTGGTLTLSGANTYTGTTNVNAGTLTLTNTIASQNVNVTNGATLNTSGGDLAAGSTLTNAGTVAIAANETIGIYNSTGTLSGAGTLTAGAYNLNNGSVVNANTGTGIITTTGIVNIASATTGASQVTVQSGTLTAAGTFANAANINVNTGAILNSNGILAANATLAVSGTANVNTAAGTTVGTLAVNAASGTVNIVGAGGLTATNVTGGGTINLTGGNLTTVSLNGNSAINLGVNTLTAQNGFQNGSITGTGNLIKNGGGVLTLAGTNGYTGTTNVNGGILIGATPLNTSAITIANGASYQNQGGLLNAAVTISNQGTFTLFGDEQASVYNSNGGLLNGLGTLTAPTYNLSNGAITAVGADLGAGTLNTAGVAAVTLNGDSAAETVNVNSGTLNLNGELTAVTTLNISPGAPTATVNLGGAERINDPAVVNLFDGGTLNLNGTETIQTLHSFGTVGGSGTLITTGNTIDLNNGHVSLVGTTLQNHAGPNPQLTSDSGPGVVQINGNAGQSAVNNAILDVGTALIGSGQMNLNGLFMNSSAGILALTIDSAILNSGFADRIEDDATVNNNNGSTWVLNGNDTIGTYNANNSALNDNAGADSTLTATTYNLSNGASTNSLANLGTGTLNSSGAAQVTLNGDSAASDVNVLSGVLRLNGLLTNVGSSAADSLTIYSGARLELNGSNRINSGARVDNFGTVDLNGGTNTITTYNSDGGHLQATGLLTATTYNLSNGASTAILANLGNGTLNTSGGAAVNLNGTTSAEIVNVNSGQLNLGSAGRLAGASETVNVASGATLQLGGNENVNILNLRGTLRDNGGGSSLLQANQYNLISGTTIAGANLGTGDLNSTGNSVLGGNTNASTIDIDSGSLTTNGAVQNANGIITVDEDARWNVNSSYTYNRLQGDGTVDPGGSINGNTFINATTIAPGTSGIGTLAFTGNLDNNGTLEAQLNTSTNRSDTVRVSETAFIGGSTLSLTDLGSGVVDCGERFNIINANGINGAFASIIDAPLGSDVLFDRGSGDVVGNISVSSISGSNANHKAIFSVASNSAIDSVGNYDSSDGGLGSVVDAVLRACDAGGTSGALDAINSLMPEGYAGAADYALHATRSYTDAVMRTTPLTSSPGAATYGEKGEVIGHEAGTGHSYQAFGGYHSMDLASDSSNNSNDYDLDSNGGYAGLRGKLGDQLTYGGFIAIDSGSVDSAGLNLDADGYVIGAFANYEVSDKIGVWGSLSYGDFSYDGDRTVLGTRLNVEEFDADALQIGLGADYEAYNSNGLAITPGLGLRFIDASTDSITETGGPAALNVEGIDAESLLLDFTVKLAYTPENAKYGFSGYVGYQHDFEDGERDVDAAFAAGGNTFSVVAPGLGDSAVIYGAGGYYDITDDLRFSANYHGESRSDADELNSFDLRFTYGF